MKRCFIRFLVGLFFLALLPIYAYGGCEEITLESIQKHVPFELPSDTEIISQREVKGLCEVIVRIRGRYAAFYVGKDFVISGQMFSNKESIPFQEIEKKQTKLFLNLKNDLEKVVAIMYTPSPTAHHAVYMFTDPRCPWCNRMVPEIKRMADEYNIVVKLIFYPVHLPRGKEEAIEAICRKLDLPAYLNGEWKKENKTKSYQCEKGKKLIKTSMEIGKKLGISGVPTFYLEDGKMIVGANVRQLEEALSKLAKK